MGSGTPPRLVLASASPRRQEIVGTLGVPFEVRVAAISERPLPGERPEEAARRVARMKAEAVVGGGSDVIVGADTMVVVDGAILGKPADAKEALEMLRALRGRCHQVITGVAALNSGEGRMWVQSTTTGVCMRQYGEDEIAAYVASGEPYDKAGGYAIQSTTFRPVARIDGCYLNVVGLPLCALVAGLCAVGFAVPPLPAERLPEGCRACEHAGVLAAGCT